MTCMVCGRILKSHQSIELGYGSVCYRKAFGRRRKTKSEAANEAGTSFLSYDIPGQMSIEEYLAASTKKEGASATLQPDKTSVT